MALCKRANAFKRPIIESSDKVIVGWNEESLQKLFIKKVGFPTFYYIFFLASFKVSAIINDNSKAWSAFNLGSH